MKTNLNKKVVRGFTLVEMIGVLAVIAILAGMLIPKIFEAIRNSRINATIETYNTLKAAVLENYAKYGRFGGSSGAYTGTEFDKTLIAEGRIDALARDKIPISQVTQYSISDQSGTTTVVPIQLRVSSGLGGIGSTGYDLDGEGSGADNANATYTVELLIYRVAAKDAYELSLRLDGAALSTSASAADNKGRVQYNAPDANNLTDVYIYIAHQ